MSDLLLKLAAAHAAGQPLGIPSVCSAHPVVLTAAMSLARQEGGPVLIEATCNQVNQFGGYTGKTPEQFAAEVRALASAHGVRSDNLILGGDHLGPNPWRKEAATDALAKAEVMVADYVKAGFGKIHLDASMSCAGDPPVLDDAVVAQRAARLAKAAERAASAAGLAPPLYILGTEVPVPGGADHVLDAVEPTAPEAALATIKTHRDIFASQGLEEAFGRCIAFVVQPGVEFGSENVVDYRPERARKLSAVLEQERGLVFEAHSTDYQSEAALSALVRDGFPILKVGPGLTFALREALYGLDMIASELDRSRPRRLRETMERLMLERPNDWKGHYHGDGDAIKTQLSYSYSDRMRYYWGLPEAQQAVTELQEALRHKTIPATLVSQYLSRVEGKVKGDDGAEAIAVAFVTEVLASYSRACGQGFR
jgi:D-tagatose-bisphosphate aldolase class II non-catalytic subunit